MKRLVECPSHGTYYSATCMRCADCQEQNKEENVPNQSLKKPDSCPACGSPMRVHQRIRGEKLYLWTHCESCEFQDY